MEVICRHSSILDLAPDTRSRLKKHILSTDGAVNLQIGYLYIVYGVIFRENSPWYYLCVDENDEYPTPFASELFDVVDPQLSACWQLATRVYKDGFVSSYLVFSEWARDEAFYERLVDGDERAVEVFARYRRLMDRE